MTDEVIALTLCMAPLMIFAVGGVLSYLYDRAEVLRGCCGGPWETFAFDSQGGEGLRCPRCGKTTWVSWYLSKKKGGR